MDTLKERSKLAGALESEVWKKVFEPRIRQHLNHAMARLVVSEDGGDRLRGYIAASTWILDSPWKTLEEFDQRMAAERQEREMDEITERILAQGFRAAPIDEET